MSSTRSRPFRRRWRWRSAFALALARSARVSAVAAHDLLSADADPAGRGGLAVPLHLPAAGRPARPLPRQDRPAGPNWLGDPDIALWSLVAFTVWKNAGYYMLFFLAGLQGVPRDLLDAAKIDGAGPRARASAMSPCRCCATTFAFVLVIALIGVMTQVDHVFVLTKGGPSDSTNLILFYIYQQAVERYEPGRAAAATVVSVVVLLAITAARSAASTASRERAMRRAQRADAASRLRARRAGRAAVVHPVPVDGGRRVRGRTGRRRHGVAAARLHSDRWRISAMPGTGPIFSSMVPQYHDHLCGGILAVQLVTMSLAGYAFARLRFPGRDILFNLLLVQMMVAPVVLIVPNLKTIAASRSLRHAAAASWRPISPRPSASS